MLFTPDGLFGRIGVQSARYYIRFRTLRWVGHVARMQKRGCRVGSSAPHGMGRKLSANRGTEVTCSRSLERRLKHADLPPKFSEWSKLVQDRPKWRALISATCVRHPTGSAYNSTRMDVQFKRATPTPSRRDKKHRTYRRSNKNMRCERAAVPVAFPTAAGRVLAQLTSQSRVYQTCLLRLALRACKEHRLKAIYLFTLAKKTNIKYNG